MLCFPNRNENSRIKSQTGGSKNFLLCMLLDISLKYHGAEWCFAIWGFNRWFFVWFLSSLRTLASRKWVTVRQVIWCQLQQVTDHKNCRHYAAMFSKLAIYKLSSIWCKWSHRAAQTREYSVLSNSQIGDEETCRVAQGLPCNWDQCSRL